MSLHLRQEVFTTHQDSVTVDGVTSQSQYLLMEVLELTLTETVLPMRLILTTA